MRKAVIVLCCVSLMLGSCTQRLICPAYQSAFIYDKDELRKKFSYFQQDSTPKILTASKNKYLVAEPVTYQRKIRSMQTVEMKPVFVHVPDSLTGADSVSMEDLDRAARSIIDSTYIVDVPKDTVEAPLDSIYVITKDKELRLLKYNAPDSLEYDSITQRYVPQAPSYYVKDVRYNLEQDNYMWYLRDAIVLPDVKLAKLQQAEEEGARKAEKKKEKRGLRGLFRKKPKEEVDSAALQRPPVEEFDFIDEADTVSQAEIPQPGQKEQKKGLFGRKKSSDKKKSEKKKSSKKKKNKKQPEKAEPKIEEKKEEDDGF